MTFTGLLRRRGWLAAFALASLVSCTQTATSDVTATVEASSCRALQGRVDALPGNGAVFLRSYDGANGAGEADEPALKTAAFVYDEALAVIALLACDAPAQAARIGEALRLAAITDQRLRNVYRAGAVEEEPLRNGWWNASEQRWVEDAYQAGTSTGNVAWVALALLALHDATKEPKWREAASGLARWVISAQSDTRGEGGFRGGVNGFDEAPVPISWKSTEHALDLVALFDWLAAIDASGNDWKRHAAAARAFVTAQWDDEGGYFIIGSDADGVKPNRQSSALDVQLWSQLLPQAEPHWKRALDYAERAHGVDCGFDFNADRDGIWLEGTAQAALAYRVHGDVAGAQQRLDCIAREFSPSGYVYATREPRITTGLAADGYYFRLPHLGATAWAALAATGTNPYVAAKQ